MADPVDRTWLRNSGELGRLLHRWWGYRASRVIASPNADRRRESRRQVRALCFSLGVDSFDVLLRAQRPPDLLVGAGGFDIPSHSSPERIDADASAIAAVADHFGIEHRFVRTNLREHPTAEHANWVRAHGGALAALGHLVDVDELWVSASSVPGHDQPWGSHWGLDPLYSSARVRLVHTGHDLLRFDKLRRIATSDIALEHLRVCPRLDPELPNCSECAKCLVTMAGLDALGALERATTFGTKGSLVELIDALPAGSFPAAIGQAADAHPDPAVAAALRRLRDRVPPRPPMPSAESTRLRWAKQRRDALRIRRGRTPQKTVPSARVIEVGPASVSRP